MRIELRGCWYRLYKRGLPQEWRGGNFHQWGLCEDGGTYSVGIVEDQKTGAILTVEPKDIHFGIDPDVRPE